MRLNKASLCLSALLVLGGCPEPDPNPNPNPDNTPKLSTVTVTCDSASISATRPVRCTASATDQNGQSIEVSGYTWTSNNESVAKVSATGRVSTFTQGAVTLSASATANGVTQQGQAALTVTQAQPTVHETPITANETWRETGNPHVVSGELQVKGAATPTLTLEAGTVVHFGRNAGLFVGFNDAQGELIIKGTADAPVLLTADSTQPQSGYWKGVFLGGMSSGASSLTQATIEYAGAPFESTQLGSLNILGEGGLGVRPVINNVTVQKSSGTGVYLGNGGSFGTGSTKLISRDNGGYPISVLADQVRDIPTDVVFSGNAKNAVEINIGALFTSQTWPNFGIPYVLSSGLYVGSASNPTLTLQPGTELRFENRTGLFVGSNGTPGALKAVGTAGAPIRFVPNTANPDKGQTWRGLSFWLAEGSKLDHVVVSFGGIISQQGMGNVNVYREIGPFMTNSTFSDSAVCGVTVSDGRLEGSTPVTTDFTLATYKNTFINNEGGAQCTNF